MIYQFEDFELDVHHFELRYRGEVRPLPRKSFDLLRYLLANAGRVVEKEEIFEQIWPSLTVSENVLPVTIRTVRRAIGDDRGRLLRTVRSRGYTIVCAVRRQGVDRPTLPSGGTGRAFIGRERLMQTLETQYAASEAGDGQVVLLYGDAGIGKSRALQEFARWARTQTRFVFLSSCQNSSGGPAYWPFIDLIRQAERVASCRPIGEAETLDEEMLDGVKAVARDLLDPGLSRGLSSAEVRFRIGRTLARLLQRLAQVHPVVLLVDDLHLAEEDTLEVADSIIREVASDRVIIVATYRDAEIRRGDPSYVIARIAQGVNVEQVALRGLDAEEVAQFVREEADVEPPPDLVRALCVKTEGNPFFLRETVRWLLQENQLERTSDVKEIGLPSTVRDAILRRLDRLDDECNRVLSWAAVAGRSFTVPLLAQVTELSSEAVLRRLGEAENARIISSREPGGPFRPPGEYGFVHPVMAETLYQQISAPERVRRHRAVAEALEVLTGRSNGDRLDELAHHFFQAAPAGEVDRATLYASQAAARALEHCAYDDAIRHLRNALLAEELRSPRDDLRYCAALLELAEALSRAGRHEESEPTFHRAADLARELGDAALLSRAALGLAGDPFRTARIHAEAVAGGSSSDLLFEAESLLSDTDVVARARILATLARRTSDPEIRVKNAEHAVALARKSGSDEALFDALMAQLAVCVGPQKIDLRLKLAVEAVRLAMSMDSKPLLFLAHEARIPLLFTIGDMTTADRSIATVSNLAERLGVPAYSYTAARFEMCRIIGDGDLVEARKSLERVMSLGRQAGDPAIGWIAGAIGLWLLSMDGRSETVTQALSALTSQDYMEGAAADAFAAHFHMSLGDRAGCAKWFDRAAEEGFSRFAFNEDWLWNLSGLADLALYLRDHKRAAELYELLLPYGDLNIVNRIWTYRGSMWMTLGRIALALGDVPTARSHMEEALTFNRRIGVRLALLFTRFFYAEVLEQGTSKQRSEAQMIRKEVMADASRMGLRWLFEREAPPGL